MRAQYCASLLATICGHSLNWPTAREHCHDSCDGSITNVIYESYELWNFPMPVLHTAARSSTASILARKRSPTVLIRPGENHELSSANVRACVCCAAKCTCKSFMCLWPIKKPLCGRNLSFASRDWDLTDKQRTRESWQCTKTLS